MGTDLQIFLLELDRQSWLLFDIGRSGSKQKMTTCDIRGKGLVQKSQFLECHTFDKAPKNQAHNLKFGHFQY